MEWYCATGCDPLNIGAGGSASGDEIHRVGQINSAAMQLPQPAAVMRSRMRLERRFQLPHPAENIMQTLVQSIRWHVRRRAHAMGNGSRKTNAEDCTTLFAFS
jgi:hypothetical protein